jgi:uncharacterized phage protein (TIGR01671 family)
MQDRFKFRIWDKKLKKLAKWGDNPYHNMEIMNYICVENPVTDWRHEDYILMQCTGLKDKNNKLIYEGDIINIWCKNLAKNQISDVFYCEEIAAFCFHYETDYGNIVPCTMVKTEIEVIGNIYENKELLCKQ